MTGIVPPLFFLIMLKFVCPIIMIIIFTVNIISTFIDGASYARYDVANVVAGNTEVSKDLFLYPKNFFIMPCASWWLIRYQRFN